VGFFDRFRRKPPTPSAITAEQLLAWAIAGESQRALDGCEALLAQTRVDRAAHAAAWYTRAEICLALDLVPNAIESMRSATEIAAQAADNERNHLTYLLNLGELLAMQGELEAALATHEEGLRGRKKLYSEAHPGYGFGLDSWAEVALALGQFGAARRAADEAVVIYENASHARIVRALALRLIAACGEVWPPEPFPATPKLANQLVAELGRRKLDAPADAERRALELLTPQANDANALREAWVRLHDLARREDNHKSRIAALTWLHDHARGDDLNLLTTELGLGLACEEAQDIAGATSWYETAVARARRVSTPDQLAGALRNAGIYFARREPERGLSLLREAVNSASPASETHARSMCALGIELQHRGERDEAATLLRRTIAKLAGLHPDAVCASSHLGAIERNASCGCGEIDTELSQRVEAMVRAQLDCDFIVAVRVEQGKVTVETSRDLAEDEARRVEQAIELSRAELRRQQRRLYG
jgi:tetratricopeptide (TPR) repeat protein